MTRLNTNHKKVLAVLRTGARKGDAIALAARVPIREVGTALRALKRAECVALTTDRGFMLTEKGHLLAAALYRQTLRKQAEG